MTELTMAQRAAVLIAQLSEERAGRILRQLSESEVIAVMAEIARLPVMSSDELAEVVADLREHTGALASVRQGGAAVAQRLLTERLGAHRAQEIMDNIQATVVDDPLAFISTIDPVQLTGFLTGEHPQTFAVVLSHIRAESAAHILERLDDTLRTEVTRRVAKMGALPPHVIQRLAAELELRLSAFVRGGGTITDVDGVHTVVEMLNFTERATEKQILTDLEASDPDIAERIRNEMFVFDDVVRLTDQALQLVLRQVVTKTLAVALKGKPQNVLDKFVRNISERAAEDLAEDMGALGPQRLSVVEAAESAIVKIVRNLADAGDIVIERAGDELVA